MLSGDVKRIRDALKKGITLDGRELDQVVISNMDLEELHEDVQVTQPDNTVKTVRRPLLYKFNQQGLTEYLRKHKRL